MQGVRTGGGTGVQTGTVGAHGPGVDQQLCVRGLVKRLVSMGACEGIETVNPHTWRRCWGEAIVTVSQAHSVACGGGVHVCTMIPPHSGM